MSDGALFVIIFSRPDPNTQIAHRFLATAFGIGVGFDWPDVQGCWDKVQEEIAEVQAEMTLLADGQANQAALGEELGDLMFALVNVVRKQGFQPETLLRQANQKFETRFRAVEQQLAARGKTPAESDLTEMDALWDLVKQLQKTASTVETK